VTTVSHVSPAVALYGFRHSKTTLSAAILIKKRPSLAIRTWPQFSSSLGCYGVTRTTALFD
jgi:hypothetical protein